MPIRLRLHEQIDCEELSIDAELAGSVIDFNIDSFSVSIKLPEAPPEKSRANADIVVTRYRTAPYTPLELSVKRLNVYVSQNEAFQLIPSQLLLLAPAVAKSQFPKECRELDEIAHNFNAIGRKAYDLWLRMLRWKTADWRIGRGSMQQDSGGVALMTENGNNPIWRSTARIIRPDSTTVTSSQWIEVSRCLNEHVSVPLPVDLYFDARKFEHAGDTRRATLDAAIAIESYIRDLLSTALPAEIGPEVRAALDEVNIRKVFSKILPELGRPLDENQKKGLNKIFDLRNTLAHTGSIEISKIDCNKALNTAQQVLEPLFGGYPGFTTPPSGVCVIEHI